VDSHLAIPTIAASRARLDAVELVPFRRGIAAGADTVMIGHMRVPVLEAGEPLPATISPAVVQTLLRGDLGFAGVAVTDCLEMDAIARGVGVAEGAIRALAAGADLVLVSHRIDRQEASLAAVRAALASGRLSPMRPLEAIRRLDALKRQRLSWDRALTPPNAGTQSDDDALSQRAYERSTTLARDDAGLLPLRLEAGQRLLLLDWPVRDVTRAVDIPYSVEPLARALRKHHDAVETLSLPDESDEAGMATLRSALASAAAIVVVTLNAHLDPTRAAQLRRILAGARPAIGVAVCNPYDAAALPEVPTFLLTYEYSAPALHAAAEVIFGARSATGRSPVSLTAG
jgi:beta-N-acetylhexosaminidase